MEVVKTGLSHKEIEQNCQDAVGTYMDKLKVVCDGCSAGKNSEVGAKLFCKLLIDKYANFVEKGKKSIDVQALIMTVMDELVSFVGSSPKSIKDYLSFTILVAEYDPNLNVHTVYYCGDGYIILQKDEVSLSFRKLDCGEYPEYLSYNYIDGSYMNKFHDGVRIKSEEFELYYNVGVASDGIRFILDSQNDELIDEFGRVLKTGRNMKLKLFCNRNEKLLKDDVSVAL